MAIYLLNIALMFFWSYLLLRDREDLKKKKIFCIIAAVQWILISGLRHWSVGADTEAYSRSFETVKRTSWGTLFENCGKYLFEGADIKDPGYNLFVKIFQIFSGDYQAWLFFIAILFTGLMAWWIYKNSELPEVSFLVYSTIFYAFFGVTGHRQTIATALVVFLGYELIKKKKYHWFALVAFIAFMIHKSSVVFIVYALIAHIGINAIYGGIVVLASVATAIFGKGLYGPIALELGYSENAIEYTEGGAETYATVLMLVCIAAFICYKWIKERREDVKFIYNMVFITFASTLFIYQNQSFMRIQQYYSLIIMILIPEIIMSFEKKNRQAAYLAVVGILIIYLMIQNPQYRFCFA